MTDAAALRAAYADEFARVALDNFATRYPYAAHHTTGGPDDRALPAELHPAFATSYDWHSSVHMHWLAVRLVSGGASAPLRAELIAALATDLARERLVIEAEYLRAHPLFERPYGWGWVLALSAAVAASPVPEVTALAPGFAELDAVVFGHVLRWLALTPEPVRHGVHGNSAFGLRLALGAARTLGRTDVERAATDAARRWFGADHGWPFDHERSGQDFLSPGLAEADLMAAALPPGEFAEWVLRFFEGLRPGASVLRPAAVADEHDGQQVHLFGLGLSTAAAGTRVAAALRASGGAEPRVAESYVAESRVAELRVAESRVAELVGLLESSAPGLIPAGLEAAVSDEFMSSHWLATFAWDALEALGA